MRPKRSLPPFLPLEYQCDEHGRRVHLQRIDQLVVRPVGNLDGKGNGVRDVCPVLVGEGGRKVGGKGDLELSLGGKEG